jgi:hypothetical protein
MSTGSSNPVGEGVTPQIGLGATFDAAPKRSLEFSSAATVAGVAPSKSWEPTDTITLEDEGIGLEELRNEVLRRDGRCVYCGLRTSTMQVDSVNDLHIDLSPENLAASDPLCHGYHHLSELSEKDARVVYLPGLDPTDVNHLQRLLMTELQEGDEDGRSVARELITWLASHDKYTKDAFGTADPALFGHVLSRVDESVRARRGASFENLALVYNPSRFREFVGAWRGELLTAHARSTWASFFQDVMRLLA